ncbi:hypothetical protein ACDP63_16820 [Paracoccus sp. P2]|uniref:hypothetical protein n=1 Tax=Paracoccus sp. P2 TaxID=3248840 RepID=UPI00391F8811
MAALTKDRQTPERSGKEFSFPVKASTQIFAGSIVVLAAGLAEPGKAATGLIAVGRAEAHADNRNGGNGDIDVPVRAGVFRFDNSASADLITRADIGADAWIVDDQTVAKTDGSAARSKAGRIVDVDDLGVWVQLG